MAGAGLAWADYATTTKSEQASTGELATLVQAG